jgi:hypothetical protein
MTSNFSGREAGQANINERTSYSAKPANGTGKPLVMA